MKITNIIEFLLLAAMWGGSFLFMRIAAPDLGPVWLIEIRVLLAGLTLLPILYRLNLWTQIPSKLVPLMMMGCFNFALPFLLFAFATLSLPAGFTAILNATAPLFATAIALVWLKENLTISQILGLGMGFSGVTILVGWKTWTSSPSFLLAIAAGLSAALMYAIAAPYAKRQLAGVSPLVITTMSLLSAALFLLPVLPFTVPKTIPTATTLLSVLALSLFSTAVAYLLYFRLIEQIGSTKALTVTYLIPVFAMIWGALILKEQITPSMVFGCGLILLGTGSANNIFNYKSSSN